MIGRTISHFEVLEKIGEGGMGMVYKARDTRLDRLVAIKVLPPGKLADPERRRRFVHEAKAASALNHPSIITIHEIFEADGADFIVMELVRGRTLSDLIPHQGLPLNRALHCGIQIADALSKAHAAGIVHRDLKPANVMVTDDGLVKVLDFGLARLTEPGETGADAPTVTLQSAGGPRTEDGAIVGTFGYMSPEQAEGRKVDARSDIFAFGTLLYEMLTGRRTFQGESKMATLAAILREEPKPIRELAPAVPHELEKLITRCLRKSPERRMQSMIDVRLALEELKEESESGQTSGAAPTAGSGRRVLPWAAVLAAVLVAAGTAWYFLGAGRRAESPAMRTIPVTSFPGIESDPALSPDGKQVAFTWNGDKEDNFDIYVKLVDAGTPLRLTTDQARDDSPAWSPDGRFIAFCRAGPEGGVFLVPALGGPERRVADVPPWTPSTGVVGTVDWSADGKHLAILERASPATPVFVSVLNVETREKRKLTSPPPTGLGDYRPRFSPDGRSLAFIRSLNTGVGDIYRVQLSTTLATEGEPRRITFENRSPAGYTWTPDGSEFVFSSTRDGPLALWRVSAGGSGPPRRVEGAGQDAYAPSFSRQGGRLAYTHWFADSNIWRLDISGSASAQARLISSSRPDSQGEYSPDGRQIAFLSGRSGASEVWFCGADGANPVQLTTAAIRPSQPHWSPDGRYLAYAARPGGNVDIYVIGVQGGAARRLTTEPSQEVQPRWSHDGKWIYFSSTRTGRFEGWKTPADGSGSAAQVTRNGGWRLVESFDGKFLYYDKIETDTTAIFRMPSAGGEEIRLLEAPRGNWAITPRGIYFDNIPARTFHFFDFASTRVKQIAALDKLNAGAGSGLSVSPDERWLIYANTDQTISDIMIVENFR